MKVQFEVDEALWREVKSEAALQGQKLNRFVDGVLRNSLPYSKVCNIPKSGKPVSGPVGSGGKTVSGPTPPAEAKSVKETQDVPVDRFYGSDVVDPLTHRCHICKDNFPQTKMQYHAKSAKWACLGCVDNQKNSQ